jgi:hypothetical protein
MSTEYEIRTVKTLVVPKDSAMYSEMGYTVEIVDESGGEFVVVNDQAPHEERGIRIDDKSWPTLRAAIDTAFDGINKHEVKK